MLFSLPSCKESYYLFTSFPYSNTSLFCICIRCLHLRYWEERIRKEHVCDIGDTERRHGHNTMSTDIHTDTFLIQFFLMLTSFHLESTWAWLRNGRCIPLQEKETSKKKKKISIQLCISSPSWLVFVSLLSIIVKSHREISITRTLVTGCPLARL